MRGDEPDGIAGPTPRSPFDWFFRSRVTGEITIAQFPNVALWVFIGATVGRMVVEASGPLGTVLGWVALGALVIWAVDELVRGVNPWRRILGAAVLVWQLVGVFNR